jgi:hypothetical protein
MVSTDNQLQLSLEALRLVAPILDNAINGDVCADSPEVLRQLLVARKSVAEALGESDCNTVIYKMKLFCGPAGDILNSKLVSWDRFPLNSGLYRERLKEWGETYTDKGNDSRRLIFDAGGIPIIPFNIDADINKKPFWIGAFYDGRGSNVQANGKMKWWVRLSEMIRFMRYYDAVGDNSPEANADIFANFDEVI